MRLFLTSVVLASWSIAASALAQTPSLVDRAANLAAKHGDARRQIGLAEMRRARGDKDGCIDELHKAGAQELVCWRMLPVAPAPRDAFRAELVRLRNVEPANPWLGIWELYLLSGEASPSAFCLAVANAPTAVPEAFPTVHAEECHLALLQELGLPRVQTGLDVIAARDFTPLHALRDLDRALTRTAEFLRSQKRDDDAKAVMDLRDHYRQAYARASRHLIERLFAMRLMERTGERDAILAKAKKLPYLSDRARLAELLERISEDDAWKLLVQPLLSSELALIANPPDLTRLPARHVAKLQIKANQKSARGELVTYEGDVRFQLGAIDLRCAKLTVLNSDNPSSIVLTGNVGRIANPSYIATADRFTYTAETGALALGGDVRLTTNGKTLKLRSCTLTARGELRDPRSLLDDFKNSFTLDAKLNLLPKITAVYDDAELPDDVRFLLALKLLQPHLTWRAPYLPPLPDWQSLRDLFKVQARRDFDSPWRDALGGEDWMLKDIPESVEGDYRAALRAWYTRINDNPRFKEQGLKLPDVPIPEKDLFFWRLCDPKHRDVQRAMRLLQGIGAEKAQRWRAEAGRNNTVLTFDIPGAAAKGKTHSLLMDARNAERVAFKLYRVRKPDELVYATQGIGKDFIYRDHHLDGKGERKLKELIALEKRATRELRSIGRDAIAKPTWQPEQLVYAWQVQVADLKHHDSSDYGRRSRRHWDRRDWYDEADARYFDDECSEHRERLDKSYRPYYEYQLSSWQCDRVVPIPGKALSEAGAYVLVAEANGQTVDVPIVVEPISLTLRRCRDGVFVLATDADGKTPLEKATVHALGQVGEAVTDQEGVAFARVLALGDRAIVVQHQGRYAIGGFGAVFEGIYQNDDVFRGRWLERLRRARPDEAKQSFASVYADRHVVAAYTDRPTYRPGQEAHFKLIVRKLQAEMLDGIASTAFRAQEFDAKTQLALPDLKESIVYTVFDPKGREIAHGNLALSDFGTAAGKIALNTESVVGAYSLRVHVAGQPRLVPDVFAVKHYRRPNFEVTATGVPESLTKPTTLKIDVSGQYYFGPPVAKGTAQVRVWRQNQVVVERNETLDETGNAKIELRLPRSLAPGKYAVVTSVTDDSGRTVSASSPLRIEAADVPKNAGLDKLPRFIAINRELKVTTTANEVRVRQDLTDVGHPVKNGVATFKFTKPGWYHVEAGDEDAFIFAYGGEGDPRDFRLTGGREEETRRPRPKWVNLSDFALEEDERLSRWDNPDEHLYALFDRQSLKVGDKLRLLVYVPHKAAKLLFTVEGRTIVDYHVRQVDGSGYHIVEIPMKERYFPNVYLQGRIVGISARDVARKVKKQEEAIDRLERVDDDDRDPRWCRVDVAKPAGKLEGEPLNVRIETQQATYQPGDSVRAVVKVTDRAGWPQAAEVSLAAVDESVFAFGEDNLDALPAFFQAPANERRFYPKAWRVSLGRRWSEKPTKDQVVQALQDMAKAAESVSSAQTHALSKLEQAMTAEHREFTSAPLPRLGGELPIGQIPLAKLREHFHETAAWLPQVQTDADGIARASFTLPDSLTRYRLTSVALTKTTEVGVGRARITASLPLAVQVFLPRFAIEKDRVLAVALVHNHTEQAHNCAIAWQIEGAAVTGDPVANARGSSMLKFTSDGGKLVGTSTIQVAAKSSAKLGVWLKLDKIGEARVAFRASAGKESDAEVRTLPIQPLGRAVEFNANNQLPIVQAAKPGVKEIVGAFNKEGSVTLPAGFLAREIEIGLAASDLAQALTGLDYLVDYPYGCIEQTMSRFLPAVMVKHATRQAPIQLQPDVAAKLPDILQKGLARIYGHQNADGSWGWFAKDGSDMAMSVYVVYGLARCQASGVKVDRDVLQRGCDNLLRELRTNKHEPELAARAWHALALAGDADGKELTAWARKELDANAYRPVVWCNLALACKSAGLNELGERFWAKVAKEHGWWGHDTETFALRLNTQLAFGAPYRDCMDSARRLLARRTGTYWSHTRDTSWAIEALANMFGYVPEKSAVRRVEITIDGKKVQEIRDPAELKKMLFRVKLTVAQLPEKEGLEIRFKSDSDEPIHVSVRATGVQRMDEIPAAGTRVQLRRRIESLDGNPIKGPLKIGEVVRVRLRLDLTQAESHLLIEERRPALCEFADDRLTGPAASKAVHQEFRDDRLCVFFSSLLAGTHEIVYYLRAETPGTCSVLPGCAYPMYDPKERGETAGGKIEVR